MPFTASLHHRRSIRLRGYDYASNGAYFVTICTWQRETLFGEVTGGEMMVNDAGQRVMEVWQRLPLRFPTLVLDVCMIMPNHFHSILFIDENRGAASSAPTSLGMVVRAFKSLSALSVNRVLCRHGTAVWQRNYHEHIIRSDRDLTAIRTYISDNPVNWAEDIDNPERPQSTRCR